MHAFLLVKGLLLKAYAQHGITPQQMATIILAINTVLNPPAPPPGP